MQHSSSTSLQDRFGADLVAMLVRDVPSAEIDLALADERHPLAVWLQTAVEVVVGAGRARARSIVAAALAEELLRRQEVPHG